MDMSEVQQRLWSAAVGVLALQPCSGGHMSLKSQLVNHPLGAAVVLGVVLGALCIVEAFVIGKTFGQRCAVPYERNSTEWRDCVDRLSKGQPAQGPAK